MGGGSWTTSSFMTYATTKGVTVDLSGSISTNFSVQDNFKQHKIHESLNPYKIVRECRDSDEHPNTIPVILALDVTGSMGSAAVEVAKKLNVIMTDLYSKVKDVEFCVMGIGDTYCDRAPIQMSQFESDIRIAEAVDNIYFEGGGGGNDYESYSAAWYMGLYKTKLDCHNRGKKGIIITMGDEQLNPYFDTKHFINEQSTKVETPKLFKEVTEKFNVYHLSIDDKETNYRWSKTETERIDESWSILGDHYKVVTLNNLAKVISDIICSCANENTEVMVTTPNGEISW